MWLGLARLQSYFTALVALFELSRLISVALTFGSGVLLMEWLAVIVFSLPIG